MIVSAYWQFVKLDSSNQRQTESISVAQIYFQNQFTNNHEIQDSKIVRQLWQQMCQSGETSSNEESHLAEICLRCYISHQIDRVCWDLGVKFGNNKGFSNIDLLPFVLPDEVLWMTPRQQKKSGYKSLATSLLQTFHPDKGRLNTWVKLYVKQHPELKIFLLQHGVFIISDWALLNDTSPQQLQRIFADFYHAVDLEIKQKRELLISYHAVYRQERLRQRMQGIKLACQPPTFEQLTCIGDDLKNRTGRLISHELLLSQLQGIAAKLRRYRIVSQGGSVAEVSFDQPDIQSMVEDSQLTPEDEEKIKFLKLYHNQFIESLDHAISQVIDSFILKLQRKVSVNKNEKSLLTALHLFHCQGQAMGQIAAQIGFKKQYEVTRFLKLNEFRADIRQRLLINLRDRVLESAKYFTNSQQLETLDKKIEVILNEQIDNIIKEAESETKRPVRNQPLCSLLARRLCRYLDKRGDF